MVSASVISSGSNGLVTTKPPAAARVSVSTIRPSAHDDTPAYTGRTMTSVAEFLRARTRAQVLALPAGQRIQLALALGDDDADRYARREGLDRIEAARRLHDRRAHGRRTSAAADAGR
jgi:hypothetical protein